MEERYYLYRWVRLDKNEPFYIGIGTKTKTDLQYGTYTRSRIDKKGNNLWKTIKNKTVCEIEIMLESDNYDFIKEKEKEFIKLYGRIDLKTGCLANMTDGGEGTTNVIVSNYSRELRKINATGRKLSTESILKLKTTRSLNNYKPSNETKRKIALTKSKSILQFSLDGKLIREWGSVIEAGECLKIKRYIIANCANIKNKKSFTGQNYIWVYKEDYLNSNLEKFNLAIERAKVGKVKTFYTEETRLDILNDFYDMGYSLRKEKKIKELSKKYKINYSTTRAIIRNYELNHKITATENINNRNKEIYNSFMASSQLKSKDKILETSRKFNLSESYIREIIRKFK